MSRSHGDLTALEQLIICLWGIWCARNEFVFTRKMVEPKVTIERALAFLLSYKAAQGTGSPICLAIAQHSSEWLPPTFDHLKLNVDAAFTNKGAGYGFVLRDHRGTVLISGAGPLSDVTSVAHAKLLAIWRAADHIQDDAYVTPILVESDCLHLV